MYYTNYKIQSTANRKEFVTIPRYRTTNGGIHIPRLFSSKIIFEVLESIIGRLVTKACESRLPERDDR